MVKDTKKDFSQIAKMVVDKATSKFSSEPEKSIQKVKTSKKKQGKKDKTR